jgi:hypothetical protein
MGTFSRLGMRVQHGDEGVLRGGIYVAFFGEDLVARRTSPLAKRPVVTLEIKLAC